MFIDALLIILLLAATLAVYAFARRLLVSALENIVVCLFLIVHLIYSGMGIVYNSLSSWHVSLYVSFTLSLGFGLIAVLAISTRTVLFAKEVVIVRKPPDVLDMQKESLVMYVLGLVFIISLLIPFVYPVLRIGDLFRLDGNALDTFTTRSEYRITKLTYIANIANLVTMPIFIILIARKVKSVSLAVLIVVCVFYISVAQTGYISRSGILQLVAFVWLFYMELSSDRKQRERLRCLPPSNYVFASIERKKLTSYFLILLCAGLLLVAMIPILVDFTYARRGVLRQSSGLSSFFNEFMRIELEFPVLWNHALEMNHVGNAKDYFLWLVTLPLPATGSLLGKEFSINYLFSEQYLGFAYGAPGFYVKLISLVGEGLLLFGSAAYWLHGAFIGAILGLVIVVFIRNPKFKYWGIYLGTELILMARGGTQGALIVIVKNSLLLWAYLCWSVIKPHIIGLKGKK